MKPTALVEYELHLRRRGLADGTILKRIRSLELLEAVGDLGTVTKDVIEVFLDERRGRHGALDARTRHCWVSHLHCFYQWAMAEGMVETDPTARLVRPKLRRKLPRPIPEAAYLAAVNAAPTDLLRAWLLLTGNAGLRCCEVAGLLGENVLPESIRVVGKGDKERVVPMHPTLTRHAFSWPAKGPVFTDPATGLPYKPAQISRLIGDHFRRNGLPYRAHMGRHRFATAVYEATGDLAVVAELCGHESTDTARGYALVSPSRRARAVQLIA